MARFVDLGDMRRRLAPFYSSTGRPSVDPELMIRMLIVGYAMGIRSERRLCEEVHLNLAYRWFCRLDLTDPVPDHSTFSKNRHGRFRESDLFRHLFESVVARCIVEGLVGGHTFAPMPASSGQTRTNSMQQPRPIGTPTGSMFRRRPVPYASISTYSTMPPLEQPARLTRSSRPLPIRPVSGPAHGRAPPSLPIPTTTWSTRTTASSSM